MSTRELLTRRQILLIIAANAIISAVISLAVGLVLVRPARIAPAPTPTATVQATAGSTAPAAGPTALVHVVVAGDTISGLAVRYDVPQADIIAANQLQDPDNLQVGMQLIIPVGGLPQITPTWTPEPTPTETQIPFQPPSASLTATALAEAGVTPTASPGAPTASPAAAEVKVEITEVISAGNADREAVVIKNNGGQVVNMAGWTLSDANGNIYTFADVRLWEGGSVTLNTRIGQNGNPAFNFFWGKLQSLWSSGETATLRDAAGTVVSTFTVGP